jgi:hypothetical protein
LIDGSSYYTKLDGIPSIKRLDRFLNQRRIGSERPSNIYGDVGLGGVNMVSRSSGVPEYRISTGVKIIVIIITSPVCTRPYGVLDLH